MADVYDWDDDWDDGDDTPAGPVRSEEVDFYIYDTGVGWAELDVSVGPVDGQYGFSLIWDPLDDIRRFQQELSAGRTAQMTLRGEPGAVEVLAEPDQPEGWVRLRIWLIDYKDDRELDLEAFCPAQTMAESLRAKTGFLAIEQREAPPRSLWRRFYDWLHDAKLD